MTTYTVTSIKTAAKTCENLTAAVTAALAIQCEHQPSCGVDVTDDATGMVAVVVDAEQVDAAEMLADAGYSAEQIALGLAYACECGEDMTTRETLAAAGAAILYTREECENGKRMGVEI